MKDAYHVIVYDLLIVTLLHYYALLRYCRYGGSLPISIIMLKFPILDRKRQDSGVMVEPKIIIGTLNPLNLLRCELW